MTHRVIAIPGETTRFELHPTLKFTGGGNIPAVVTIKYRSSFNVALWGEIAFTGVLECRWIKHGLVYDDYASHFEDRRLGLIEIVDSAYVAAMDARGWQRRPGQLRIYEDPVRHFRMDFGKWGELNVIATDIEIHTVNLGP